ncbi:MAG: glycosyltransferase family 2 protein [Desulfobacterales bacterium]|nr:glycosyltransferase family 2 protein [Desulfobacteraceae bacterium]MBT7086307.1 glycosyltransferase family 2 protein [Desulfobacterales bacterium]
MNNLKVSVIIPAYNEGPVIGGLVSEVSELYPDFEIIVINDGSHDDTASAAENAGAKVYSHPYNIGNGAAIKTGIRVASGDILVFMDGDGQHEPKNISLLLKYFPDHDMTIGSRSLKGHASPWRAAGNRVFDLLASYVANFKVEDLTSGFRAVKADVAKKFLYLLPNTYSYPTTLTLGALRSGRSVKYIPVNILKRKEGQSDIKVIKDGVRFFMIITKICTLYSPLRIFLPVSFLMFILGVGNYFYTFLTQGRFTNMSALLIISCIIIFMMGLISEQICQMRYERRGGDRNLINHDLHEIDKDSI